MNDILKADIDWKPVWYLLGNGPTLKYGVNLIPLRHDAQIVACNGAVCMCPTADYWMVRDINLKRYPWFESMFDVFAGVKIFSEQYGPDYADYSWVEGVAVNYDTAYPVPGVLRSCTTVGGDVFQLACLCGAKEIYFVGMDQTGRDYGNDDVNHLPPGIHEGVWNSVNRFNGLIGWAIDRGITVKSLTPTALDVEVI
jgi:hypothetical protein